MHATFSLVRRWQLWLWVAASLAPAVLTGSERGPSLTGIYSDEGVPVASDPGVISTTPSLHGLLRLEFDPAVASVLQKQTARIKVRHEGPVLAIEVEDEEGTVAWSRQWREGESYVMRGRTVVLRFREARFGTTEFIMQLETVTEHGLLQMKVQRVTPTILGPAARSMGTYLFYRLP